VARARGITLSGPGGQSGATEVDLAAIGARVVEPIQTGTVVS